MDFQTFFWTFAQELSQLKDFAWQFELDSIYNMLLQSLAHIIENNDSLLADNDGTHSLTQRSQQRLWFTTEWIYCHISMAMVRTNKLFHFGKPDWS